MPRREGFTLESSSGRPIHGELDLSDIPGERPTVIDCHGFKGFMEWGFHPYLANLLAGRGFTVVRLNVASSGMLPGDDLVTDEVAFSSGTIGDDVQEICDVLSALADGRLAAGRVDADRMGLFGHSRGGGITLLAAASDAWRDRVKALVTWASVGTFERFSDEEMDQWRHRGALPVVNARTGQELELSVSLLDDGQKRRDEYDLESAAARRTAPWLILHGSEDETVPVAEGSSLHAAATGVCELHVVEGGDHTFGAQHPFQGPNPRLIEAMNATQRWLRRYLAG